MSDFIEIGSGMKWLLGAGGAATASGAIWHYWLGPAVRGIRVAITYLQRSAVALEQLTEQMPEVLQRLDEGTVRFNEHGERIERLESRVFLHTEGGEE